MPFAHWQGLTRLHKLDYPDFFNNSDLSCSPCHHSGSLLRTKSSAYVLELERAMISMKASKLGLRKEDSALIFVTCEPLVCTDVRPILSCITAWSKKRHFNKELRSDI